MIYALVESLRLALGSLRSNLLRSLLTTLGIVIGITTVIAIISVITGLNQAFATELSSIGSNVIYVQKFHWAKNDWSLTRKWKDIGTDELEAIQRGSRLVDKAAPYVVTFRRVKNGRLSIEDAIVYGVGAGDHEIRGASPAAGRLLLRNDFDSNRNVVVIGWDVAEKLYPQETPIGKPISVAGVRMQVVGVLDKRGSLFGSNLDTTITMPIGTFMKHFGRRRMMTISILPKEGVDPLEVTDELRGILRRVRKVPFGEPDNFAINRVDVLQDLYAKLTGGLYAAMFGVGTISLLVGGIGIMNIMLVSVTERTREIGIRMAVGAKSWDIRLQFIIEAVILSLIGGLIGVLLGILAAEFLSFFAGWTILISTYSVVLSFGFSGLVGIFFGFYPAYKASLMNPIDALRHE